MSIFSKHHLADDVQSLFVYGIYHNDACTMMMFLPYFVLSNYIHIKLPDSNWEGKIRFVPFDRTV